MRCPDAEGCQADWICVHAVVPDGVFSRPDPAGRAQFQVLPAPTPDDLVDIAFDVHQCFLHWLGRRGQLTGQVREAVDRLGELERRVGAVLVDPPEPARDGGRSNGEDVGRLLLVPAPGRLQREDRQPVSRWVVRSLGRRDPGPACILDLTLDWNSGRMQRRARPPAAGAARAALG